MFRLLRAATFVPFGLPRTTFVPFGFQRTTFEPFGFQRTTFLFRLRVTLSSFGLLRDSFVSFGRFGLLSFRSVLDVFSLTFINQLQLLPVAAMNRLRRRFMNIAILASTPVTGSTTVHQRSFTQGFLTNTTGPPLFRSLEFLQRVFSRAFGPFRRWSD